jgi:zinc ribbon protein
MALSACPQCGHMVSPSAAACPACGHPIAATKKQKAQTVAGIGCGCVMVAVIAFFAWAINEGHNIEDQEKAHPTCVSDYKKCTDNKDVVEHHQSRTGISMTIECKAAAEQAAKYGTPELPFFAFGMYRSGRSYIDSGIAVLVENDAQFKNGFGASEHVIATCFYDLAQNQARVTLIPK